MPTGTWTTLANPLPGGDGAGLMLLLSDGTVMVQGGYNFVSGTWYKLTPDSTGNYIQGAWSQLASMHTERVDYASSLLPDGRVFVLGGEYSGPSGALNLTNAGEIYDPVANTWTNIANFPEPVFGDDPSEVLPNGQVLAGYKLGPETYVYDPADNTWSAAGSKLHNDPSREETWVKLPDNSILSYDITSSLITGTGHAQRYIPSLGQWVDAGTVPVPLSAGSVPGDSAGHEIGPAFLLPDGRAFFLGATGNTAFYTPPANPTDPGSWAAGPIIPNQWASNDAGGALLPDGHVLFVATDPAGNPRAVLEFDPATNSYTNVTPQNNFSLGYGAKMLVLPTGQVMLSNGSGLIDVFTPDGAPEPAWQPTIRNITDNGNSIFTLTGTQLNGLSEGAGFGDDAEMASNYPIVRLTDAHGNVSFARTFNWSSTGVATGSTPESVEFTLPAGDAPGAYLVSVIANGIASTPVLDVQAGSANTSLALQADSNAAGNLQVLNGGSLLGEFSVSSFGSIVVTGSNADNTIAINNTFSSVPLTVNEGAGHGIVTVGDAALDSIQGPITINGRASDLLILNDQAFTDPRIFTITDSTIAWGGPTITYVGLGSVTVSGGTGGNTFDLLATSPATAIILVGGGGDTLAGSNSGNTFDITGSNSGILRGASYGSDVVFSRIGNLTAGSGGDTFSFADGASLSGNITGGGGDTVDYTAYRSSVLVDLQTGFATGVGGLVSGITTVFGGSSAAFAGGVYNLLIGKGGDTLYGGFGRPNILVAGASASTLVGGGYSPSGAGDQDILIAGSTAYDTEAGLSTWQQIAAFWASGASYDTRVAQLLDGMGVPVLNANVVTGNGGGNTLIGYYNELALLYTDGTDTIADFDPGSHRVMIAP